MKKLLLLLSILALSQSVMAKDYVVNQKGKEFDVKELNLKVGDTITFKNSDNFAHNAYSDDEANEFDIGMQKPGQDITVKMSAKSTVEVECAIHPNMHMTVNVK